jgi:MoxR-like ATPase
MKKAVATNVQSSGSDGDLTPGSRTAEEVFDGIASNISAVLRGKHDQAVLAVACLLAEGHLLIEDRPGTGKTSLARAIAASINGTARRIQFTPDLLPSDVTGVTIFDQKGGDFRFRPGPVFANVVIADEINRASPKTQAALLEVMQERNVTIDGITRPAPRPFIVVATQNPLDFHGTYPLPEVQLDRFALKIELGYTDAASETEVLTSRTNVDPVDGLKPIVEADELAIVIDEVAHLSVSPKIVDYVVAVVLATRAHRDLRLGVSTRGSLTLLACARAFAAGEGRDYVEPDDIQKLVPYAFSHRVMITTEAELDGRTSHDVLTEILGQVELPR